MQKASRDQVTELDRDLNCRRFPMIYIHGLHQRSERCIDLKCTKHKFETIRDYRIISITISVLELRMYILGTALLV